MSNFYNDYNQRSMDDHFSMMPVLAQEFINYTRRNLDKFDISVDLPHGTTIVYETESDEFVLIYKDTPIKGFNSRNFTFNFNGFEYNMHVFLELKIREWTRYNPVTDRYEVIDCQTFIEKWERFKREYDPMYFSD